MEQDLDRVLRLAAVRTFEDLCYLFAEDEPQGGADDTGCVATVAFTGPVSGTLRVAVTGGLAGVVAANMLGLDEEPAAEDRADVVGEIANVICGHVLPAMSGDDVEFDITSPVVASASGPSVETGATHHVLYFDEGRADLYLTIAKVA